MLDKWEKIMGRSLFLDTLREIRKSFGRFIAIFGIVALGVAFYAGVSAASSDMKFSADAYFDEYNLMDFNLLSSVGFTEADISAIENVEGIEGVFPTHTLDALTQMNTTKEAVKIMTLPLVNRSEDNENYVNRVHLVEGRLPEKSGECVVKHENIRGDFIQIGDVLTVSTGTDTDISDVLKTDSYEVVGFVDTPYYLSYEMGSTTIGNGSISYCVMVPDEDFILEYYTQVFATVQGAKEVNSYDDSYFDLIDPVTEQLEEVGTERISIRIQEIKDKIATELPESYRASAEEEALSGADEWQWYVLDRNSHYSYRDYGQCADRMSNIAKVFPVFFIFVAALVCLTTMTRMVDEQRGTIGTLKALGYSKFAIAFKYISYSLSASLLGGVVGCIIGLRVFPTVIYTSWNIVYSLPPISYADQTVLSVIAVASMSGITTLAAFGAVYAELVETPALLMRPKAPKRGKKILLEHITPVWKRLSFTGKVTARNIFRYKKRFFMTVIGIAGCSALLLAGFGIKDSISCLIKNQFYEILKYDVVIEFKDDIIQDDKDNVLSYLIDDQNIADAMEIFNSTTTVSNKTEGKSSVKDNTNNAETTNTETTDIEITDTEITDTENFEERDAELIALSDASKAETFLTFRKRGSKETYQLTNDGVIISEKLSNDLNVKKGDTILLTNSNGANAIAVVSNICEMYVNHYVFLTDEYYAQIFSEVPEKNSMIAVIRQSGDDVENRLGQELLAMEPVDSVSFFSGSIEKFDNMIQSLDLVTYVLIISAALLAFVVLYNLTNVNISERLREIATIKVLGFYDNEVSQYVYRENIAITVIGAVAGLILGIILHGFIMKVIEMDSVMFGNAIEPMSYGKAFLLTMIFSVLVNLFMYGKIKKIPMVESLKSVE